MPPRPTTSYRWPPQRRLKLYLVEHGISNQWLAATIGLAEQSLGGIMSGRVRPSPRVRALIGEALGQPAGVLFTDIDDPTPEELAQAERLRSLMFPQQHAGAGR